MAGQRQGQVLLANTDTIVAHFNQPGTALLDLYFNTLAARINGVLNQLFCH